MKSTPHKKVADELVALSEVRSILPKLPDDLPVTQSEAAQILSALGRRYTALTLGKLRSVSTKGPRYQKAPDGRVTYLVGDLKTFAGVAA